MRLEGVLTHSMLACKHYLAEHFQQKKRRRKIDFHCIAASQAHPLQNMYGHQIRRNCEPSASLVLRLQPQSYLSLAAID